MTDNIEQLTIEYSTGHAALFGEGGQPIYAPAEQERRQGELKAGLENKVASIVEAAQGEIDTLQGQLKVVAAPVQPLDNLSEAELSRAGSLKPFIEEDVSRLGLGELGSRLTVLLEGKDRATLFLYVRALPGRLQALKSFEQSKPEAIALARLLREAEARLTTPADSKKVSQIKKQIEDCHRRQGAARKALQEATTPHRRMVL